MDATVYSMEILAAHPPREDMKSRFCVCVCDECYGARYDCTAHAILRYSHEIDKNKQFGNTMRTQAKYSPRQL